MKKHLSKRILSLLLTFVMLLGFTVPAGAANSKQLLTFERIENAEDSGLKIGGISADETDVPETTEYADSDVVRVSIVLEDTPTIAMFGSADLVSSDAAVAYRSELKAIQDEVTDRINSTLDDSIDVVWNLTLAANIISANVRYGQIEEIEAVDGVQYIELEERYESMAVGEGEVADPDMGISTGQIGSGIAWAEGYTGAGSKIAIIDTGTDTTHQSFNADAWNYSMSLNKNDDETLEQYKARVGVMTMADLTDEVIAQLNAEVTAENVYYNDKFPYAYNYVDGNYTIDHMHDDEGEHGSHVAGIAAANSYIYNTETEQYDYALDSVKVQGVAPDAQLFVMKVFGAGGGAYAADYMAAIEDAVVLGADSINLSLGSPDGFSRTDTYASVLDGLVSAGVAVATMSSGNSSYWASYTDDGYLYAEDVSMHMSGNPGAYTHALSVANVMNDGFTGNFFTVGDTPVFYTEPSYTQDLMTSIAGEYDYVVLPTGVKGEAADFDGIDVEGKIVFIQRGGLSFYVKAENAVNAGAIATVIYNNTTGTISMSLSGYTKTNPCVAITLDDALTIMDASTSVENGKYYTGKMTVKAGIDSVKYNSDYYTMTPSSSWGVPGSLELKPEITAPGGNIYSVYGSTPDGGGSTMYTNKTGTSMSAPQMAGMVALMAQYIRETGLDEKTGQNARVLATSLLMSTAEPIIDGNTDYDTPYSILNQGAGLANVGNAINARSYILVKDNLSGTGADGKVKAEFGDDPNKTGVYEFDFDLYNISGEAQEYTFSAELFTQALFTGVYDDATGATTTYLDTLTTPLMGTASFTAEGVEYTPVEDNFQCDVNRDGRTDSRDVQYILDYTTGKVTDIDAELADLNENGTVDTNDAYILLEGLSTITIVVPSATEPVSVHVTITLTEDQKAQLDANYPNGAYVEGYVYINTVTATSDAEGELIVDHSIPMLGFYGNWSDASAIDTSTYLERLYETVNNGVTRPTYVGLNVNYTTLLYSGDKTSYIHTVNPYAVEDEIPYERAAIRSDSTIGNMVYTLIRNAGAVVRYFKNETTGEMTATVLSQQLKGAYYNSGWKNTSYTNKFNVKPTALGVDEGETFTTGLVFIPEYYEIDGAITDDQAHQIIQSGVLGEGAYFTNTFTVDNTAPEMLKVSKDLETGAVTVAAQDDQYVAYIGVYDKTGLRIIDSDVPEQDKANDKCSVEFALDDSVGEYITVIVADYAGNESSYRIYYGGTPVDYTGRVFGFTAATGHGSGQRWVEIDPAALSDTEGMETYFSVDYEVYAAAYTGKYVFFAAADGFYAAEHDALVEPVKLSSFAFEDADEKVAGMAYNAQDNTMYVLTNHVSSTAKGTIKSAGNRLYTLDLISGQQTKVADISLTAGGTSASYITLRTMTVDDAGNFYGINAASGSNLCFYTWMLSDIAEGALALEPVEGFAPASDMYATSYSSLAYNTEDGVLYFNGGYSSKNSNSANISFYTLSTKGEILATSASKDNVVGIYVVPENTTAIPVPEDKSVTSIELSETAVTLLENSSYSISASVYPWQAEDKSVVWSSSDPSVATVDNGDITALSAGETTITVTSVSTPAVSASCAVTVEKVPGIQLNGLVWDVGAKTYWSTFNTNDLNEAGEFNWTKLSEDAAGKYYAGALHDGKLIVHDTSYKYGVSTEDFSATTYGSLGSGYIWSDAATFPALIGANRVIALANSGVRLELIYPNENSKATTWNLSAYASDPMAVIAYYGTGTYTTGGTTYDANYYYMMTESGALWKFIVYEKSAGSFTCSRSLIGETGLDLSGVSAVTGGQYASMVYDQSTGYLLISTYLDGDTATLYAVHPSDLILATVGTFGYDVWPVVCLYQTSSTAALSINEVETRNALTAEAEEESVSGELTIEEPVIEEPVIEEPIIEEPIIEEPIIEEPVNVITGGLNSVDADASTLAVKPSIGDVAAHTAKVSISDTEAASNGKYVVTYDATKLTYQSCTSSVSYWSIHNEVSGDVGTVTFSFASAEAVAAGSVIADLTFQYAADCVQTSVTVATAERDANVNVVGESTAVELTNTDDTHSWVGTVTTPATCTTPGVMSYTCQHCGITKQETIPATGHNYVNGICSNCGGYVVYPAVPVVPSKPSTPSTPSTDNGKTNTLPYTDVKESDSFYDAVKYLYEAGIMNGMTATTFGPNTELNRAMVVTILYRMEGEPAVDYEGIFSDVKASDYYAKAVEWAAANDIARGFTDGTFQGMEPVTLEQLAAFINRYAEFKGITIYETDLSEDASVSSWAEENVAWAVAESILSNEQAKRATKIATRAEVAVSVYTFIIKTAK